MAVKSSRLQPGSFDSKTSLKPSITSDSDATITSTSTLRADSPLSEAIGADYTITLDELLHNALLPRMNGESAMTYITRLEKRLTVLHAVEKQLEISVKMLLEEVRIVKDEVSK